MANSKDQIKTDLLEVGKMVGPGIAGNLASKVLRQTNVTKDPRIAGAISSALGLGLTYYGYTKDNAVLMGAGIGMASDGIPTATMDMMKDETGAWKNTDIGAQIDKYLGSPAQPLKGLPYGGGWTDYSTTNLGFLDDSYGYPEEDYPMIPESTGASGRMH